MDFASGDAGQVLVEQSAQGAKDAALGLSAQTEENEIVAREDGINNLRGHGIVVADNAGENGGRFMIAQALQ